jgi:hypothetical protein
LHRWFHDTNFGMCRVVGFGAYIDKDDEKSVMEPTLHYTYLNCMDEVVHESSSLAEVVKWVKAEKTNYGM